MSQFIEMFKDSHSKVQIKDICYVVSGKSIPSKLEDIEGSNPYVKVADFNIPGNEKYITTAQRYVSDDSASYSKLIPKGSVLFAKNGAASMSNKKRLTKIQCCIDMNTMAIIPKNGSILSDFLFATIESMDIASHVRQGAIPSISPKSIEDSYIVIPTKTEQCKYISLANQADKSEFVGCKSQFIEMFGDPMTNSKGWVEYGKINQYAQIVLGSTPNSKEASYWDGDIKWITPAEMTEESYYIYDTDRHITEDGVKSASLTLLPYRSVLFSTRAPIGKVGLVGSPMYCNQGFKNFICGDKLNPVYLYYTLIYKREYLVSLGTGTTFKELSKRTVEGLDIAIPPLSLQEQFENIYHQADKSEYYN